MLHKNKATLKFRKKQDSLPNDTHTYTPWRNLGFSEILMLLCFYVAPVLRFALLPYYRRIVLREKCRIQIFSGPYFSAFGLNKSSIIDVLQGPRYAFDFLWEIFVRLYLLKIFQLPSNKYFKLWHISNISPPYWKQINSKII